MITYNYDSLKDRYALDIETDNFEYFKIIETIVKAFMKDNKDEYEVKSDWVPYSVNDETENNHIYANWEPAENSTPTKLWKCTHCKGVTEVAHSCHSNYYSYCPVCGADMNTHIATVGDEVINPKNGEKFIVHRIYTNNNIFYYDGFNTDDFYIQENTKNWKPTGNHYDEIESLINKIGRQ